LVEPTSDQKNGFQQLAKDEAPWTIRQTLLGVLFTMFPWIALALILHSIGPTSTNNAPLPLRVDLVGAIITLIFSAIIEGAFLIAPFYFADAAFRAVKRRGQLILNALGFRTFPARRTTYLIIGLMVAIFAVNFLYSYVITTFHLNLQTNDQVILERSKQAPLTTYATLFAAVFIAPFCEEVFFRGFVFPGLRRAMPVGWAIVVSALLFAVAHADPGSFAVLFIIGFALAFLRWRTGSIWPGMILHILNNGIGALSIILVMQGATH
jgi:membrane protease YdiL (CAAX protease family)